MVENHFACEAKEQATNKDMEIGDFDSQEMEYLELHDALDEICSCLDELEKRNQALHTALTSLLESNRKMRKEFQDSAADSPSSPTVSA